MFKFSEIEFDVREQSLEGHMTTKSVNRGIDRRLDWVIEIRTFEKLFLCDNYGFDTPESIKLEIDFPNRSRDWKSLENTEYNIGDDLSATEK